MRAPRHSTLRRAAVLGGALVLLAALLLAGGALALELLPAVALVALAAAGWLPGEARIVRALARRGDRRPGGPAPLVRLRGPRHAGDRGRRLARGRSTRGPPLALVA